MVGVANARLLGRESGLPGRFVALTRHTARGGRVSRSFTSLGGVQPSCPSSTLARRSALRRASSPTPSFGAISATEAPLSCRATAWRSCSHESLRGLMGRRLIIPTSETDAADRLTTRRRPQSPALSAQHRARMKALATAPSISSTAAAGSMSSGISICSAHRVTAARSWTSVGWISMSWKPAAFSFAS